jgi:hypothetical protein
VYEGMWIDGKFNGLGRHIKCWKTKLLPGFERFDEYTGSFENGHRHGTGTFKSSWTGAVYEGRWINGMRSGFGTQTFEDGDVYRGDWKEDCMHGSGTYTHTNCGNTYVGAFARNKRHGYGELTYKNGDHFSGEFNNGKYDKKDGHYYVGVS